MMAFCLTMWDSFWSAALVFPHQTWPGCLCDLFTPARQSCWRLQSGRETLLCYNFRDFAKELIRVFDPVLPGREAAHGPLKLKQSNNNKKSNWIHNWFSHILKVNGTKRPYVMLSTRDLMGEIKDALAIRDAPRTWQSWSLFLQGLIYDSMNGNWREIIPVGLIILNLDPSPNI